MAPNPEFFSVAAQVIPVLGLTGVLEGRLINRDYAKDTSVSLWLIGLIVATAVGESAALYGILETPTWREAAVIVWALGLGIILMASVLLWSVFMDLVDSDNFLKNPDAPFWAAVLTVAVSILILGALSIGAVLFGAKLWTR